MSRLRVIAAVSAVYFLAAKLGLHLAVVHPYASAVWPGSGLALAALLWYGRSAWPGIFAGAFLANLSIGPRIDAATLTVSLAIASGNTLEALAGAWLTRRFASGLSAFDCAAGVFRFSAAALASTLVSATIGVLSLLAAGLAGPGEAAGIAITWWIGAAAGDIVVAPLLLSWRLRAPGVWSRARLVETAAALATALGLAAISFTGMIDPAALGVVFLCTPVLLWPAFRLGLPETVLSLVAVDSVAVWAWVGGLPTALLPPQYAPLAFQAYMGVTAIMLLAIAATQGRLKQEREFTIAEIARRRQLDERIQSQQKLLRLVIDGIPGLVAYLDPDYRYQFVNSGYAEWFQRPGSEIEGRTVVELAGEYGLESIRPYLDRALAGEAVEFEREYGYVDRRRTVHSRYVPDRGPDGSVRGLVILVDDITARADALRALRESEEKFRRIVETASEGIWIVDLEGVTTFVNDRMCRMVGYKPAELVGRLCFDLIHPDDRPRGLSSFESRKQGTTTARDYRLIRKDGAIIWIHYSAAPLRDAAGAVSGILGMCTDITESKLNEARYQALFATSQDGVMIVNERGIYVDVNPSYCAMLKTTREQLVGSAFAAYIPKDRLAEAQAAFRTLVETGRHEGEFPLQASDGSTVELEWRSIANFVPGLHCCVERDVGGRKRFEQQMQQTQKLESLGVMAGGIAHDFNNLLVGVLGNASVALESSREPWIKPMLQDVVTASERAAGLVRQMLAYAGQGSGTVAPTDVSALIRETVTLLKASIPKNVALQLQLPDGLPCVESDPAQLQQVIMNMVINAAEAIPEGCAGVITVAACARRLDETDRARSIIPIQHGPTECVEICFRDTGSGMSPEVQRKIFDPFFTTKFTGRGLGLSAVLGIVRAHGGTLMLESAPDLGTTFRVLLPATAGTAPPRSADSTSAALPQGGSILVIDDEETVRAVARRALESRGYAVWTAGSVREALDHLDAHAEIGLAVLDLAMPGLTGDQVAPLLRARRPDLPIVVSSGYSETEVMRRFHDARRITFLQKPYTTRALAETVAAMLRKSHSGAPAAAASGRAGSA